MAAKVINPMENILARPIHIYSHYFFHTSLHFLHQECMIWPRAAKHSPLSSLSRPPLYNGYMAVFIAIPCNLIDEVYLGIPLARGLVCYDILQKRHWGRRAVDLGLVSLQSVLVSERTATSFSFTDEITLVVMYVGVPCECLLLGIQVNISRLYWALRVTY